MLPDDIKRDLMSELAHSENRQAACIEAMQIVQKRTGWVSDQAIRDIAEFLEMTAEELEAVATFYNHIYRKEIGAHVILICESVSCWILGYESLLEHIIKKLGINLGETTPDGLFTLIPVQCLGACHEAPAIMIDGKLHTNLDGQKFDELMRSYSENA
jgi:NADH-quinone oxidoreductase subunit E